MRKLLVIIVGLLLLILASGVALLAMVDPSDHKGMVEAWASEALGLPVRIDGPIEIERSMTPMLVANDVRIGDPHSNVASIAHAEVSVVLSSLLFGPIHLPHIGVDTATIELPLEPGGGTDGKRLPRIDRIVLSNISLRYREDGAARNALLEKATFEPAADGSTTALDASGDLDGIPFEVTGTTGSVEVLFAGEPKWPLSIAAQLGQAKLTASGSLSLAGGRQAAYQLDVHADLPASSKLARDLVLPALPMKASAEVQAEHGSVRIKGLAASLGESDLSGDLTWRSGTPRAALAGQLASKRLALGEILASLPIAVAQDKVSDGGVVPDLPLLLPAQAPFDIDLAATIGRIDLDGQPLTDVAAALTVDGKSLTLEVGQSSLGEGSVRGRYAVESGGSANRVALKLETDALDLPALFDDPPGGSQLPKDVSVKVELAGTGSDLRGFLGSASGPIGITTGPAVIDDAFAALLGRSLFTTLIPDWSSSPGANIICSVVDFEAEHGKARSTVLVVDAQRVVVGGGGAVELATGKIDFLLLPKAKGMALLPLVAPVHLVGTVVNPTVKNDARDILRSAGHLLLGIVNPLSLVTPILHPGLGGTTPCQNATLPAAQRENLFERAQGAAGDAVRDVGSGIGAVLEDAGKAADEVLKDATGQ